MDYSSVFGMADKLKTDKDLEAQLAANQVAYGGADVPSQDLQAPELGSQFKPEDRQLLGVDTDLSKKDPEQKKSTPMSGLGGLSAPDLSGGAPLYKLNSNFNVNAPQVESSMDRYLRIKKLLGN